MTAIRPGFLSQPRTSLDWEYMGVRNGRGQVTILFDNLRREYTRYLFLLDDCRPSLDGASLSLQVGNAAGLFASAYEYHLIEPTAAAATYGAGASTSAGQMVLASVIGNAVGENYSGELMVTMPDWSFQPVGFGLFRSTGTYITSAGVTAAANSHGHYNSQGTYFDRIGFAFSGGATFTAGAIYQWALKRRSESDRRSFA